MTLIEFMTPPEAFLLNRDYVTSFSHELKIISDDNPNIWRASLRVFLRNEPMDGLGMSHECYKNTSDLT